jgi:hypothetical protein
MRFALAVGWILIAGAALAGVGALPLQPARHIDIDTDEGTWLSPDLSPDGSIVFEMLGDLYRIPPQGGAARALTRGMAFDSQPVFSPDGRDIAFISDRSGSENIWVIAGDGSSPRQLTDLDEDSVFASPAWSADGKSIFVSRYRAANIGFELWRYEAASGAGELVIPIKAAPDQPREAWSSVLGAFPSADGRFLYFARHVGANDFDRLPEWTIERRDLGSGKDEVVVSAPRSPRPDLLLGTAFRPAVSHDGRLLIYGARDRGLTGLRILDLQTGADRWLKFPIQQDDSQASGWRDLLPRHVFSRDDHAVIANLGGKIVRNEIATGTETGIAFRVMQRLDIVRSTSRMCVRRPVQCGRIIQTPVQSPDGGRWPSRCSDRYTRCLGALCVLGGSRTDFSQAGRPMGNSSPSCDGMPATAAGCGAAGGEPVRISEGSA